MVHLRATPANGPVHDSPMSADLAQVFIEGDQGNEFRDTSFPLLAKESMRKQQGPSHSLLRHFPTVQLRPSSTRRRFVPGADECGVCGGEGIPEGEYCNDTLGPMWRLDIRLGRMRGCGVCVDHRSATTGALDESTCLLACGGVAVVDACGVCGGRVLCVQTMRLATTMPLHCSLTAHAPTPTIAASAEATTTAKNAQILMKMGRVTWTKM